MMRLMIDWLINNFIWLCVMDYYINYTYHRGNNSGASIRIIIKNGFHPQDLGQELHFYASAR